MNISRPKRRRWGGGVERHSVPWGKTKQGGTGARVRLYRRRERDGGMRRGGGRHRQEQKKKGVRGGFKWVVGGEKVPYALDYMAGGGGPQRGVSVNSLIKTRE